jgi:hypothetical protein
MVADLTSMLRAHNAALGDSPAAVITAAVWTDLCSRPPYDCIAKKMDTNNQVARLLSELKDVVDATLQDMSVAAGGAETALDAALVGAKRKKVRNVGAGSTVGATPKTHHRLGDGAAV